MQNGTVSVRPWCHKEDFFPLRFDLTHRLKLAVERAGCTIAFPQRDGHMFPGEGGVRVAREASGTVRVEGSGTTG